MPNIIEVAQGANTFTTLLKAVEAAGLTEVLSGSDEFTLFAPTDSAFAAIDEETLNGILEDKEQLTKILTYHVLPGKFVAQQLKDLIGEGVTTVEGSTVDIDEEDDGLLVNQAVVIQPDIPADNGIIHGIDEVLMPPM